MPACVILNPYSNRWNAKRRRKELEAALRAAGIDFVIRESESRGQPVALARTAVLEGFTPIIAAGGDGTIGDVVNGMARAAGDAGASIGPLGVMGLGTANDLICNLKLPLALPEAAKVIAAGAVKHMDLCRVNDTYFVNNSAIGLEPYVTLIQQRIGFISGITRYLVAAIRGILDHPVWEAHIEWQGGSFHGPISLLTTGNCPRTGGVFFMTPHADPFDGKLTFVYGYGKTRLRLFQLLPDAMKAGAGNYVEAPEIHEIHSPWIKVTLDRPSPAHADGEIFGTDLQSFQYSIQAGRLALLAGP
ncbi:MAG: hypothetical protein HS115_00080 [Spirochaetales bacterium]|nr:hypothetical protein [Spirochaetales bacterium]